jgi:hypothetical protein
MSDDKVKVSMFLDAPIAQAVKIRAARDGTGVSEVIGKMFQCAHCREPISDEFIVGKPKQIAPNRFAVFFHKNRKECAAASGTEVRFFLKCPNCEAIPQQTFDPPKLRDQIQNGTLGFYCICCDQSWKASPKETEEISRLVFLSDDLTFRDEFHGADNGADDFECFILADTPANDHFKFKIGKMILEMLGGMPSIVSINNVAICTAKRQQILAACRVAHKEKPYENGVVLQQRHFH